MISHLRVGDLGGRRLLAHRDDGGLAERGARRGHRRVDDAVDREHVSRRHAVVGSRVDRQELALARDRDVVLQVDDVAVDLAVGWRAALGRGAPHDHRHVHLLERLQVVAGVDVDAGLLDHGAGGVFLDEDDLHPARGLDLGSELLPGGGVLHGVRDVVERVEVARLHTGVAALVEVDDVPVGQGDLVPAQLGAEQVEALVLPLPARRTARTGGPSPRSPARGRPPLRLGPGAGLSETPSAPARAGLPDALRAAFNRSLARLLGDHGHLRQERWGRRGRSSGRP